MVVVLGARREDIFTTASARYSLGIIGNRSAKQERLFGKVVHDRMKSFLMGRETIQNIYENQYETMIQKGGINLNVGEATLMAAVCSGEFLIATGDKRSLEAIAACEECNVTFERIQGKVVCLEQIIYKIILNYGIEYVRPRVVSASRIDTSLRLCFGYSVPASEESVIECLLSNIRNINSKCKNILAPIEP